MKNRLFILSAILLLVALLATTLLGCQPDKPDNGNDKPIEKKDYVKELKLDLNSSTKKLVNAKIRTLNGRQIGLIDGDTTHFSEYGNNEYSPFEDNILKARYLAIDTPESTGVIEDYGKTASEFNKSRLKSAESIVVESDSETWNYDNNGRVLCWIWYRTSADSEYRNLNLEILQEGLAFGSNSGNNRYGTICLAALNQARSLKLYVYSGKVDPDTYHGDAKLVTVKTLRLHPEKYVDKVVAFEGVVAKRSGLTVYAEEFDDETAMYYGIQIYLGYQASGDVLEMMVVGNKVRIVGNFEYSQFSDNYQVTNLQYFPMNPDNPRSVKLLESGVEVGYQSVTAEQFATGTVTVKEENADAKTYKFAELALYSSISASNLTVASGYTEDSGKISLTVSDGNGHTFVVYTEAIKNAQGVAYKHTDFVGKTINVKGVVDTHNGGYQIRVIVGGDITVVA